MLTGLSEQIRVNVGIMFRLAVLLLVRCNSFTVYCIYRATRVSTCLLYTSVFGEDRLRERGSLPVTFYVLTRAFRCV